MPQSFDAYLWKTKRNRPSNLWNQFSSQLLGWLTIFVWLGSHSMELYSAQITGTKTYSKVHLESLEGTLDHAALKSCPHPCIYLSVWRGAWGLQAKTQNSSDWGLKAPGTQADLEQLCDGKQGLLFQTVSHRQGSAFFDFSRWFYIVLSCSGWTWVRNFEVWGLSDTFFCALKQYLDNLSYFFRKSVFLFLLS